MTLRERVDYEEWANAEWAGALERMKNKDRALEVYRHIFSAYARWVGEISDFEYREGMEADLANDPSDLYRAMRESAEGDLDRKVEIVSRRTGLKAEMTAGQILTHMMNHGTYHRGHLRGLAEAEDLTDFPDTDALFFWLRNLR